MDFPDSAHSPRSSRTRVFKGTSEQIYRRVAYAIPGRAALVSLPAFGGLLR